MMVLPPTCVDPKSTKLEMVFRLVPMPAPMNGVMHHQVPRST